MEAIRNFQGNNHVANEEQILFNTGPQTGTTISGVTNHTGATVDFSSTTDTFHSSGGQADIDSTDGLVNNVTMTVPGFSFTHIIFNPFKPTANNNLMVSVLTNTGTFTFPTPPATYGSTGGNNFLTVDAGAGEVLLSVTIDSSSGFKSVGQWRIAGIAPFTPIPEPSSMLLLCSGVLGIAQMLRRKQL